MWTENFIPLCSSYLALSLLLWLCLTLVMLELLATLPPSPTVVKGTSPPCLHLQAPSDEMQKYGPRASNSSLNIKDLVPQGRLLCNPFNNNTFYRDMDNVYKIGSGGNNMPNGVTGNTYFVDKDRSNSCGVGNISFFYHLFSASVYNMPFSVGVFVVCISAYVCLGQIQKCYQIFLGSVVF